MTHKIILCGAVLAAAGLMNSATHGAPVVNSAMLLEVVSTIDLEMTVRAARGGAGARGGAVGVRRGGAVAGPRAGAAAVRRGGAAAAAVRPWVRRPHYGRVVAGVALGTVVTAAAVGMAPAAPASNVCWYWTDPSRTQGYWDYCR